MSLIIKNGKFYNTVTNNYEIPKFGDPYQITCLKKYERYLKNPDDDSLDYSSNYCLFNETISFYCKCSEPLFLKGYIYDDEDDITIPEMFNGMEAHCLICNITYVGVSENSNLYIEHK